MSQDTHHRIQSDLPFFCKHGPLLIKNKTGQIIPLALNRAQRYIHDKLEDQWKKTGRVRACIVKGRQQGCSTYVSARFYHKTTRLKGKSTFILSHDGKTTDKLFQMVKRYQNYINPAIRVEEGASNRNQMTFPGLEGDYTVGTAGNENVGRGGTAQLFHGSEAAYWEHDYEIQDGALESIGNLGTEIILESTGDGPKGLFHQKCMDALKGIGDYILIFVPWFWQDEYERDYNGEELSEEEVTYARTHLQEYPKSRILRKLMWRRYKIIDLQTGDNVASGLAKFKRIYPSTPIEAFQASGVGLFRPDAIMAARKSVLVVEPYAAALVAGVDPAGDSDTSDRTVISLRRGRQIVKRMVYPRMKPMRLAAIIDTEVLKGMGADMVFIDRGYGEGTIDRLHTLGHTRKVVGVAFNESPVNKKRFLNKRSEMIITYAEWLNGGGTRIPDDDEGHADLASIPLDEETANGLKYIKSKREIKKELKRSTDLLDADALTFAYPVQKGDGSEGSFRKATDQDRLRRNRGKGQSPLRSMSRLRGRR